MLEDWIIRLTIALSDDVIPGPFVTLDPGQTITISEESKAIIPKDGIVWVAHRKGHSRFLAHNELPAIGGTGLFPVTRHGWLQAEPNSEVYSVHSRALRQADGAGSNGLRDFHAIAMSYLEDRRRKAAEKERTLMRARMTYDTTLLESALLRLTSPIQKIPELREGSCSHPVYQACEVIGRRLHLTMKPHPDMLRGLNPVDPVASIARASGIRVRNVALKGEWWKHDGGPMLAFKEEGNRPLALLPRSAHSYDYYDATDNRTAPVTREVAAALNPFAYVLYRPLSCPGTEGVGSHEVWPSRAANVNSLP